MRPFSSIYSLLFTTSVLFVGCTPDADKAIDPAEDDPVGDHEWEPGEVSESTCDQAPAQALQVLERNCYRCHGEGGSVEGGFNYVLDVQRMTETGMVVPSDPSASRIAVRMSAATMPPSGQEPRPEDDDIAWVEDWISCGAEDFNLTEPRTFITQAEVLSEMAEDVDDHAGPDQPFVRYISLVHLYNQGVGDDALDTYRNGVSKLLNSLSWSNAVVMPEAIDALALIYRIDLRDYAWEATLVDPVEGWEHVLKKYPYGFVAYREGAASFDPNAATLRELTQSRIPFIFADWLVQAAAVPPLYHDILHIPDSSTDFLFMFGVDREEDIGDITVQRAGFDGTSSGVSANNRIIERHAADTGYCWVSYDFAQEEDVTKNIFLSPLDFTADGGELFCTLPNGLQAYMLEDGAGGRLDVGPREVVEDPDSETGEVINGLSCMRCHYEGVIPKTDQIRSHVLANESLFPIGDRPVIYQMYVEETQMQAAQSLDRARFMIAMDATGTPRGSTEPISALSEKSLEALDIDAVASEMGITADELRPHLDELPPNLAFLSVLKTKGMTIKRSLYVEGAVDLLCLIEFGEDCTEARACGPSGVACLSGQFCLDEGPDIGACIVYDAEGRDLE